MEKVAIGIDIGGTNTTIGFVNQQGEILRKSSVKTSTNPDISTFIKEIYDCIEENLKAANNLSIEGIGIGAPNGNYYQGTIEHAPNLAWKGIVNLTDEFSKLTPKPVFVTNDANAAAMGEMLFGDEKLCCNHTWYRIGKWLCGKWRHIIRP